MSVGENGLVARGLRVARGDFRVELTEIRAGAGEIVVLMGASGSGKSTVLHALAGFLPVEAGTVQVAGTDVGNLPPEKRRMAVVFQRGALFPHLKLVDNVAFALRVAGVPRPVRERQSREWLRKVGIEDLADRLPHEVSGGQAQRAAFARALIAGFPVCLLDEPFSSLDAGLRTEMRALLRTLVKESGVAALLVSHDEADASQLGDRVIRL